MQDLEKLAKLGREVTKTARRDIAHVVSGHICRRLEFYLINNCSGGSELVEFSIW